MSLFNACAVTDKGAVKCWGRNTYGALGNGSTVDSLVPVDVSGLKSGVTAVAVDSYESCALTKGGAVWCWGFLLDANHPLAMPTHTTPVYIYGLTSGVTAFAIGSAICGIFAGGALKCYGINEYGQVGDGTTKQRTTLVGVVGLSSGVRALATGGNFYCALTSGGTVKCWGNNVSGQLGDGSTSQRDAPVVVAGLKGKVAAIAAGDGHACAVLTAGGVECWGAYGGSGVGMLGVDSSTGSLTPVDVAF
jgi:alpha-tubulin suppressor-like RCC1 family protein